MSTPLNDSDEVRRLCRKHVPEVASGSVEIKGIAREVGRRAIVAVHASNRSVCPVGSCVGHRGVRAKTVEAALPGDKLIIVRWSESVEEFLRNLLPPARVERMVFDEAAHRATITVASESASRLSADGGMVLQLASRLIGWDLRLVET